MISAEFDISDLVKKVENIGSYSEGYLSTFLTNRAYVNTLIAQAAIEAVGAYIDARAMMEPGKLAHVYEPGGLGNPDERLYSFSSADFGDYIELKADFLQSNQTPLAGGHVFRERARIMEAGATITLKPKNGEVLAFEDDGEMVFTSAAVTIQHPGGPEAERGFADTVYEFFTSVATHTVFDPIMRRLASLSTYETHFKAGAQYGRNVGTQAANLAIKEATNAFGF